MAVEALKRSQAAYIIVFEPFVSCSRSDRTTRRNSVGLWTHFKTLQGMGCNHIVTYQLHSDKSRMMLDPNRCVIDDVPIMGLLQEHICRRYIKNREFFHNEVRNEWAFCSVDAGGEKITRRFADAFGVPLVVAHKQRDYSKPHTIEKVFILSSKSLRDKKIWIIDDMVDTGGSVLTLVNALMNKRPAEINIVTAHGLFTDPAAKNLRRLARKGRLNRIIATDTVHIPYEHEPADFIPGLEVVDTVHLSASVLHNILGHNSMSPILEDFNAERYFTEPDKMFFEEGV
jgi:ribose-phosphate pyrophosphokinase